MSTTRIVVGLDGSEGSERAVEWCRDHAPGLDAEVVAVHAVWVPALALPMWEGSPGLLLQDEEWRTSLERELQDVWVTALEGVPYRTRMVEGSPARVLKEVADEEDASMIVVGSRGRGGFTELLLGSVSHQLAHHADRPLLIVPPPAEE